MTKWLNRILHAIAIAGQIANLGFIPPKWQPVVGGSIATAQGVVSVIAHNFNPDGTPAAVPFLPKT